MRRAAFAIAILLICTFVGLSTSTGGDKKGPLSITNFGQSFFIVTTSKDKRIAFDPHGIPAYDRDEAPKCEADIVCISHNHNDHTRVQVLNNVDTEKKEKKRDLKIFRGLKGMSLKGGDWNPVNEEIGDIKIRNVGVFHDEQEGLLRGKNSVFVIEVDGWRICHLGDLGHILTVPQLKKIGPVDVLMIPVGGIYTLNGSEAKKVVDQIKPKEYIFPMHYGTKVFEDVLTAEEFLEQFPKREVAIEDHNEIILNKEASRPRPLVVQLHYYPKEEKKKEEKRK
jgi:L-ascorbate metabolism protein UlaG (beta-lactamase superfamily)